MDIEAKVIETFVNNLEFLKKHDGELFTRINFLSQIIENNEYQERYHLEYLEDKKVFDIYDSKTDSFLYNKEPEKFNQDAIKSIDFDRKNSIDLLEYHFYNSTEKYYFTEETPLYQKTDAVVINEIFEYTKKFKLSTQRDSKKFKTIDKFAFIGTLLGMHIDLLDEKLASKVYFICENNLEIFRLSLFITDYSKLAKNSELIFSIMDDRHIFISKFKDYLNNLIPSNYMIKYYSTNYNIHDYFDRIIDSVNRYVPSKFNYELMLNHVLYKSIKNIEKNRVLNTKKDYSLFNNVPVLILAAGPSLGKKLDWVKKHQKNFFIIAIGATVCKLCQNNIRPNVIISIDAGEQTLVHFPDEIKEQISDIPILSSHMSHEKVLEGFNKDNLFLFEVMTTLKNTSRVLGGASVGEVSLQLAVMFGANKIYLLGSDLALDQETGESHIGDYKYKKSFEVDNLSDEYNSFFNEKEFSGKDTTMLVKGNFRDKVVTTTVFNKSIYEYNLYLTTLSGIDIYNLSDGAYLENTIPTEISTVKNINSEIDIDFKKYLEENSFVGFSKFEKKWMKKSLDLVNLVLKELENISKLTLCNYSEFMKIRKKIFNLILNKSKEFNNLFLYNIFYNYYCMVEPYLAFNFNDPNIEESILINDIKMIWVEQIQRLCEDYKKALISK